jgi:hypothetical protein
MVFGIVFLDSQVFRGRGGRRLFWRLPVGVGVDRRLILRGGRRRIRRGGRVLCFFGACPFFRLLLLFVDQARKVAFGKVVFRLDRGVVG